MQFDMVTTKWEPSLNEMQSVFIVKFEVVLACVYDIGSFDQNFPCKILNQQNFLSVGPQEKNLPQSSNSSMKCNMYRVISYNHFLVFYAVN
jgi:hypothetical protein